MNSIIFLFIDASIGHNIFSSLRLLKKILDSLLIYGLTEFCFLRSGNMYPFDFGDQNWIAQVSCFNDKWYQWKKTQIDLEWLVYAYSDTGTCNHKHHMIAE